MGWNFRKRIKLGKYLTFNINDKGKVKRTVSLKGTGISHTKVLNKKENDTNK